MRKQFLLFAVLAVLTAVPITVHAAPPTNPGSQRDPEVRAYWTAERMAHAVAREYVIDDHGRVERGKPAAKPGGGGGGGGGGSTTSPGDSWTGDQALAWATGRVYFTMGNANYTCSGSIVSQPITGRIVVLSAGHCVYDEVNDAFATNWMFIPNYDLRDATFTNGGCAAAPARCWVANSLVASTDWKDSTASSVNFRSDYAFAVFTDANELAGFSVHPNAYPLATGPDFPNAPTPVDSFGYPAEGQYNGTDLVYCAGPTIPDPYSPSTNWGLPCTMNGGSSGGGWLSSFPATPTLASLNSYGYRSIKNKMFGPRFTSATVATYQAALTTTADLVYP